MSWITHIVATLSWILFLGCSQNEGVTCFSLSSLPISSTTSSTISSIRQQKLMVLTAKKQNKKNKATSAGAAGGFASTSSSAANTKKKSRSISSGYSTGAGSKALRDAANAFDRIRKIVGKEGTVDIYVKSPLNNPRRYWYAGKVGYILDDDDKYGDDNALKKKKDAILAQKRLILEYAKNALRPQNLGGPKYSPTLELWMAPGDSEMDCVQNKVTLEQCIGSTADISSDFDVQDVGFNPEIYVGEENEKGGLRLSNLDEQGRPISEVFEVNAGR
uniref:Uncharacterized protein n=1 Tax=Eucampia antarctica TaxID=49252 RepID=A0A7S2R307_9STRA|eukprot:CAMPEP_0197837000 /NCGR_PEP_ID=MMETSP1437-20131217/30764_1 /TAXON_ID=49252 ORGANISM="Eucampia antarctica, Strain CCMP1452" /NCGR_SAMPLE_ID=MMETSP1437 /ASSEMBLY_ACC=CAM_ASM_001096 /LENGTH=274 /DNA_ID=CAMNT_0043443657 /DNA_START=52 /DNA_END=876 /DNA_ORIENTATION=-